MEHELKRASIHPVMAHAGEKLYYETSHRHFTPAGCRIVGDLLAKAILDRRLLDAPPSSTTIQ